MDKWEQLKDIADGMKLLFMGEESEFNKGFITGLEYMLQTMDNLDKFESIMEGEDDYITDKSH